MRPEAGHLSWLPDSEPAGQKGKNYQKPRKVVTRTSPLQREGRAEGASARERLRRGNGKGTGECNH
jgi:hypothetical protein